MCPEPDSKELRQHILSFLPQILLLKPGSKRCPKYKILQQTLLKLDHFCFVRVEVSTQPLHSNCLLPTHQVCHGIRARQFKGFKAILLEGMCLQEIEKLSHSVTKPSACWRAHILKAWAQITPWFSSIKPTIREAYRPQGCQDS